MFTIRAAVPDDGQKIFDLLHGLAVHDNLEYMFHLTPESLQYFLFSEHDYIEGFVAERCEDGEIIGVLNAYKTVSMFLAKVGFHMHDLYVCDEARGQGVGKALVQHLAKVSCERGYGRIEWEAMAENTSAIDFYRKLGAKSKDEWLMFRVDGEDAIKKLAEG